MRTWYGSPAYFVLGAVHAVVFWVTVSMLTPFVLLVCLFNERRRCLHDMLVGTVVINNASRAARCAHRTGRCDARRGSAPLTPAEFKATVSCRFDGRARKP